MIIPIVDKDVSNDKEADSGTVEVNSLFHVRKIIFIFKICFTIYKHIILY